MEGTPAIPLWLTAPLGFAVLVVLAGHLMALREAADRLPASRVRIRTVNNVVALLAIPTLVWAFSVVTPARPRLFVMTWLTAVGLVSMSLVLAGLDILNNARLAARARRELRAELRAATETLRASRHEPRLRLAGGEDGRDGA